MMWPDLYWSKQNEFWAVYYWPIYYVALVATYIFEYEVPEYNRNFRVSKYDREYIA